jgi:ABC-type amino acid transport substrate-binding protein
MADPWANHETLVAASNMLHPPFSSRDGQGKPIGIEVELIETAARTLSRQVKWIEPAFAEWIPSVANGTADVAASTLGITAERERLVAFTDPYFTTTIVAVTRTGTNEPKTLAQLAGRRIATERGTTAVHAAASRLPDAKPVLDKVEGRTWQLMLAGKEIDAIVLDRSHVEKFMADAGVRLHVIAEPLCEEHFALAVHKHATELRRQLNRAIAARKALR